MIELLALLTGLYFPPRAQGAPRASVSSEALVAEIARTREQILAREIDSRRAQGAIYEINEKIKQSSRRRQELSRRKERFETNAERAAMEIVELERRIDELAQLSAKRLSALYRFSGAGFLRLMLTRRSSADVDRSGVYLRRILARDMDIIQDHRDSVNRLAAKRRELESNVRRLAGIEKQLKQAERSLHSQQSEKNKFVKEVKARNKHYSQQLKAFRKLARRKNVQAVDEGVFSDMMESLFERKGRLQWPIHGKVLRSHGTTEHPVFRFKLHHNGVFIGAEDQALVRTIHEGRVAFVGTLERFGRVVVVDHGDQYFSVYGRLGEVFVEQGALIDSQREIGRVAIVPEAATGLYFEIRHFSDSLDPMDWLQDKRLANSDLEGKST